MKAFKLLAFLFVSAFLCSCGNDDDEPNTGNGGGNDENNDNTHKTAYVMYQLKITEDALSVANAKAVITNADGANDTIAINQQDWNKVIKVNVPFSGKMKLFFTKKNDFTPTKDIYKIGIGGATAYEYDKAPSLGSYGNMSNIDMPGDKVESYLLSKEKEWKVEVK